MHMDSSPRRVLYERSQMTVSLVALLPRQWPPYANGNRMLVDWRLRYLEAKLFLVCSLTWELAIAVRIVASEQGMAFIGVHNPLVVANDFTSG